MNFFFFLQSFHNHHLNFLGAVNTGRLKNMDIVSIKHQRFVVCKKSRKTNYFFKAAIKSDLMLLTSLFVRFDLSIMAQPFFVVAVAIVQNVNI